MNDLRKLVEDLGKAPGLVVREADKVLKKGAHVIAEDIRQQVSGSETLGSAARSVSYDSMAGVGALRYEIGFDKMRRAGALGNIWEFGVMSPQGKQGGGKGDMMGALERETPQVMKHLGDLLGDVL